MSWNIINEFKRKGIHFLAISYILIFVFADKYYNTNIALLSLVLLLIIFLILDFFRVELSKKIPFLWQIYRDKEKDRLGGNVYFLLSAIIVFSIFDFKIGLTAVLITIFGDIFAALIGKRFGKTKIFREKTLEGSIAEFIIDCIIIYIITKNIYLMIGMAFTATFIEVLTDKLDDNLTVPIFSGLIGQLILNFYH